jgi:hypothetical protein
VLLAEESAYIKSKEGRNGEADDEDDLLED